MARPISPLTHFILSQPRTARVSDVIAAARREGMTTSAGNIHQVRAKYELDAEGNVVKRSAPAKGKGTRPRAKAPRAAKKTKRAAGRAHAATATRSASTETRLPDAERALKEATVAVVLAHGTHRAQAVVDDVINVLRALRAE